MNTVSIIVPADRPIGVGAIVTGYAFAKEQPRQQMIQACAPVPLSRVYRGYGQLRAETGKAPSRGFGTSIGGNAYITDRDMNSGVRLWLRVND